MDRRRGIPSRAPSSEELECWSHAAKALSSLSEIYAVSSSQETIGRVNRLIAAWPTEETPAERFDDVATIYKKLSGGLKEIVTISDIDAKALDVAIEQLSVLIALRNAAEETPPEKRNKRPRPPSPTGGIPTPPPTVRAAPSLAAARASVVPVATPSPLVSNTRDPKSRREALARQLPLQEGRKVAFHPPAGKPGDEADENTWILAVVTKCIDKNRYEVQDAEPQEDGQPGQFYNTTLRAIIPLPDPTAPPSSPAHLNAYPEFPPRSVVMALYPDTSCFYRAEVTASPGSSQTRGAPSAKHAPTYKLKFEDDDDQEHSVAAQWVVEWPGT
ncbi:hypothetical protein PLICRDRAFT_143412 [Plicaturopsis crispa FD-325 SS-3]|nr:hypothetical protein PLICRDRAFT_143412 [Plicaturopsis crispa FD-325 SS-3]